MANHDEIVSFIWNVADLIRDSFKRGHYQDVILPFTVLRRIDCVLTPTKQKVLDTHAKLKGKLDKLDGPLCKASGFAFYNTSMYNLPTIKKEAGQLSANLRNYINGFSDNMRVVLERFDFENTIVKLDTANLLYKVVEKFESLDLRPEVVSNHEMGTVFEELIRKFNEALDENPGEHFTPREVIRLMVNLMTAHDRDELKKGKVIRTVYDPCCGSGGMLTITKERIRQINPDAEVHLFGQEVNPATFAVSKSDLYIKSKPQESRDAENIAFGSVLSKDGHADRTFDYQLANPPYGKDWNLDADEVRKEAARATKNRFAAGLPRISDGQLLFLQHMLGRMHHPLEGVSRVSIIMNGSPLFTGDAGSGESEIRRWILESDYLEALIALPQQLFYNTGISTYIWVLANTKPADRKGKVLLIDASEGWVKRQKSLGEKRRDIPDGEEGRKENYIPHIVKLFDDFGDATTTIPADEPKELRAKVFPTTAFGYRKVTIERPLRLNFQASPERLARVEEAKAFLNLAVSKKKDADERVADEAAGEKSQAAIRDMLKTLPKNLVTDRAEFLPVFEAAVKKAGLRLAAPVRRAILDALSERDESAAICHDEEGNPEADPELRDTESVPLDDVEKARALLPTPPDPVGKAVQDFFEKEVKPHVPDAWVNTDIRDEKDKGVGIVGYEINFNRYFYRYQPPRKLEDIEADIKAVEVDVLKLLKEVAG